VDGITFYHNGFYGIWHTMGSMACGTDNIYISAVLEQHTKPFYGYFPGPPGESVPEQNFWTFGARED